MLQIIQHGYRIEFTTPPPRGGLMKVTPVPHILEQRLILEEEIHGLLQKGAIRVAPPSLTLSLYRSSFFLTPKKPDTWRPILNLKPLNKKFIRPRKFRMETLATIIPSCSQGMWATTLDLKDAYLHIPIHQDHQRFLSFRYKHTDFVFQALPFGLSTAPRVFTRVARAVLAFLRQGGVTLYAYIDDWLILARSRQECIDVTSYVIRTLESLGWIINIEKSNLQPSQLVTYLGAVLDFQRGLAFPTQERISTATDLAARLLQGLTVPVRLWLRLLGLAASLVEILPLCRLYMRPIQFYILRHFKPCRDPLSLRIQFSNDLVPFLQWWSCQSNLSIGRPFVDNRPTTIITTDASNSGWGASWETRSAAGLWSPLERSLHINILELLAVRRAIETWSRHLRGTRISILSDNSTTVAYLNRQGGTRSLRLCQETWDLLLFCQSLDISLRASHLAGEQNVLADALSRGLFSNHEWTLSQPWADHIFQLFGRPHVDLFATQRNCRLPTFCSRRPDPRAWATDALVISWDNMFVYAFPPWPLLQKVLLKFRQSRSEMILIAPFWPRQPWFPLIMNQLADLPFRFPDDPHLLSQVRGRILHPDLQSLKLTAWKLSTNVSSLRAFHNVLLTLPPVQGDTQRLRLTIPDLRSSLPGQRITLWIPWKLQ